MFTSMVRQDYIPMETTGPNSRTHTSMMPVEPVEFEREGTAELTNDPRFFTENVIDKRLAAFEALAIVTELMSAEAVKQCFELSKDFKFVGERLHVAIFQLIGFTLMCSVMFAATVATAVLSLQLFFTIRLMTAGPTGFDKAARFYTDKRMWLWRERGIFGVKYSLVVFTLSTGFMLYVKFWTEGVEGAEEAEPPAAWEKTEHKIIAMGVLAIFIASAAILFWLVRMHQRVFDESYCSIDTCHPGDLRAALAPQRGIRQ
uniref:Uncharacterized protein n=1 Tax=Alexandrium andersonii TaxID=327968 RepID=A0A7S2B1P2_9DINO